MSAVGPSRVYAGQQYSPLVANGIDGYVRGSGTVMNDPDNAITEWLGLAIGGASPQWVQIGAYQGTVGACQGGCYSSPNRVRLYAETMSCNFTDYEIRDFGEPPPATPNYPVYVNHEGGTNPDPYACGSGTRHDGLLLSL